MMRINLRQTKPMKRYLVYTTDDLRAGPFDATHYFVPTPHENRYLTAPVEKVGLALRGQLRGPEMIGQYPAKLGDRKPPEAAIGPKAELGKIFPRDLQPLPETLHVVDRAEIDARARRSEVLQGREERIIGAVEHGDVDEIHVPAGRRDESVGELYRATEIFRLEPRPAAEGAEAEVIAERDIGRNLRGEIPDLAQVPLDRVLGGKSGNAAIGVLHLGRAVPLQRQLGCRNFLDDLGDLRACSRFVAGPDLVEVLAVRKDTRREHAVHHRDGDLKAEVLRQNAPLLHDAEHEIRVDRVARVAEAPARIAEPDLLDVLLHLEMPGVGRVARELLLDAVRVRGRPLHHLELGVCGQDLIVHAADPVPSRPDLSVGHGEQILSELCTERLEHLLRRIERDAADEMKRGLH